MSASAKFRRRKFTGVLLDQTVSYFRNNNQSEHALHCAHQNFVSICVMVFKILSLVQFLFSFNLFLRMVMYYEYILKQRKILKIEPARIRKLNQSICGGGGGGGVLSEF